MSSVFTIVTNEFEPKVLRRERNGYGTIRAYEKLGHARNALSQMRHNKHADVDKAIIVELPMNYGIVKTS